MSACMSGTRSSGALSSKGDVLVRGVVGVWLERCSLLLDQFNSVFTSPNTNMIVP